MVFYVPSGDEGTQEFEVRDHACRSHQQSNLVHEKQLTMMSTTRMAILQRELPRLRKLVNDS